MGSVKSRFSIIIDYRHVDRTVVDGNLVTAPAWPAHPEWLAQFLKLLKTKVEHS